MDCFILFGFFSQKTNRMRLALKSRLILTSLGLANLRLPTARPKVSLWLADGFISNFSPSILTALLYHFARLRWSKPSQLTGFNGTPDQSWHFLKTKLL